ncbi:PREDICTED: prolyl 4-hydroxylase subunit alpha-2-like [Drosophila arizonae]|uniref:procollagen-proline 4-dioxygenase n=1 Tax=Drosophila arizonae TaxID=7263 RepID=A0ABM1Q497_DROAR|nr:PREDICTED: prolyl 4-hydroxylase subunit alpha-2-like [Drosophila arizonae]
MKIMRLRLGWKLSDVLGLALLGMLIQSIDSTPPDKVEKPLLNKLHLLKVHRQLLDNLNQYADKLEEKVDTMRRLVLQLDSPLLLAKDPEAEFFFNPLHSYSLTRQMHFDWPQVEKLMEQRAGLEQIDFLKQMRDELPQLEDVKEAVAAIYRVQQIYKLKPTDIANGLLDGAYVNSQLSISDCFEMGANLFEASQFTDAANWLYLARDLWDQSPIAPFELLTVPRTQISSLLARSIMAAGDEELSRAALLEEPSLRDQVEQLLLDYRNYNVTNIEDHPYLDIMDKEFIEFCGSSYMPQPTRLVCSYKTKPSKFLYLAPFKMELLSEDPYMVLFHDVIYESEIEHLNRISEPFLQRATVVVEDDGEDTLIKYRTANGAFLYRDEISPKDVQLVERIFQRMRDMSDLQINDDAFEYLKYDFGGHYDIHADYFNYTKEEFTDDRFATFVIYLNDVTRGGATVFPDVEIAVHPARGKVIHWYNMNPNSFDYEVRSYHGACPVLIGQKIEFIVSLNTYRLVLQLDSPLLLAKDPEAEFFFNPLHSYSLIRQMHFDWPQVEKLMEQRAGLEQIDFLKQMRVELPQLEDVKEAVAAIHRVQQIYKLKPADIAHGLLDGAYVNSQLSISDCFEMGANLFEASQFTDAANWLHLARYLWDQSPIAPFELLTVPRTQISSLMARSIMAAGNNKLARAELLEGFHRNYTITKIEDHSYLDIMDNDFIEFCGSSYMPQPTRLVCSYKTKPSKFLYLAPFKMELLSENPYMVVFHDVISDSEIQHLRNTAEPLLQHSYVKKSINESVISKVRTAKGSFMRADRLSPESAQVVQRLKQRLGDLSDLNIRRKGYNEMQYLNYDFGGHYLLHTDYFNISMNDRIVTFLIYLNDVTRGGGTIFPQVKQVVHPEKGKLILWYNMNSNLDYEVDSLHGACPVLIGRKTAIVYWIREHDQMFVKPCLKPPQNRRTEAIEGDGF